MNTENFFSVFIGVTLVLVCLCFHRFIYLHKRLHIKIVLEILIHVLLYLSNGLCQLDSHLLFAVRLRTLRVGTIK